MGCQKMVHSKETINNQLCEFGHLANNIDYHATITQLNMFMITLQ